MDERYFFNREREQPEQEADDSPPSTAEIVSVGIYISNPVYSLILFRFKGHPGTTSSYITTHIIGTT